MKKYTYSEHDFRNGVQRKDDSIKSDREEIYNFLSNNDSIWNVRASGNSFVLGIKDGVGNIEIYEVRDGYVKHSYEIEL